MSIGRYRILEHVGAGGMGIVYAAHDPDLDRRVALKLLRPLARGAGERRLNRLRRERKILASLNHPNIGTLLDGGDTGEGQPYLVMELIAGLPIDEYCDAHRLSIVERVQLIRTVCGAVQHAHDHGVIHRDLKPSNILVTADGVPKLVDFGIALLRAGDPSAAMLTTTGVRPMTPAYASPEQIAGDPITAATDIYSLGVILYELVTGQRPHRGPRVVRDRPPEAPSAAVAHTAEPLIAARRATRALLRQQLAGDLERIVLVALSELPRARHASPARLADDLEHYLDGRSTLATAPTLTLALTGEPAARPGRGRTVGVAIAAILMFTLAGGAVRWLTQRDAQPAADNTLAQRTALRDLSGTWATSYGGAAGGRATLTIEDRGGAVTGAYGGNHQGTLSGSLTGFGLVGRWTEGDRPGVRGTLIFSFNSDFSAFNGHFTSDNGRYTGEWNGVRQ